EAGQQPFRRDPEPLGIIFRLVGTVVAAGWILRTLVRAVGRHRDADRLRGEPRGREQLLARYAQPVSACLGRSPLVACLDHVSAPRSLCVSVGTTSLIQLHFEVDNRGKS